MKLIKILLVLCVWFAAVIVLTWIWVLRIGAKAGAAGQTAVDITYVLTRPLYLLEFVVILALAVWICWRWVFA